VYETSGRQDQGDRAQIAAVEEGFAIQRYKCFCLGIRLVQEWLLVVEGELL
jgi:hypothetical protein